VRHEALSKSKCFENDTNERVKLVQLTVVINLNQDLTPGSASYNIFML
jgi:hypothetical protein